MLLSDVAFQPTLPARGATAKNCGKPLYRTNFNPHSPHGERPPVPGAKPVLIYFNPHSPHGERRRFHYFSVRVRQFQPTLPARGATRSAGTYHRPA